MRKSSPNSPPRQFHCSSCCNDDSFHIWNPYSSVQILFSWDFQQNVRDIFDHIHDIPSFQMTQKVPHISVIPHWISYYQYNQVGAFLWEKLKDFPPFEVKVRQVKYFVQKMHCTLYAVPEQVPVSPHQEDPLQTLFRQIRDLLHLKVNRRKTKGFVPHITIGRCDNEQQAKDIISRSKYPLNATLTVDEIVFCSKLHGKGAEERLRIPLGGTREMESLNPLPAKCEQLVNVKLPPPNCSLTDGDLWKIFRDFEILKAHHNLKNGQSSGFATLLMKSVEDKNRLIQYSREHGGFPIHGGRQRIYAESFY
eukprot:CAMPEP_0117442056 /NCGR_PEP_ID=MMETSP0759-20121206/3951_1 /TAXON_ID=63605 /ORGANISM="Percolomonas cosmopolitus, Strain WS" /LENGTH=307 /DNA_ID=CAMNT_0005233925 /DNA_START=117 /DNA_END=1040 /DNA_ORIENTATION=-